MEKATKSQMREHNRQLVLRLIYSGAATNRAALAQETGLTKPAISDMVTELMNEGLLIEEGFGESTDSGGKRPRLLRFLPEARQVIGISINQNYILGVLTNLNGHVIAEHSTDIDTTEYQAVFSCVLEVINGLIAQLSSPLLCIGAGISAIVDKEGMIRYAPRFGWEFIALAEALHQHYGLPVYVSNSAELAALAQVAFGAAKEVENLVTIMVSNTVGVGAVLNSHHIGSEISYLREPQLPALQDRLGWQQVKTRAAEIGFPEKDLTYLYIRYMGLQKNPAALNLQKDLAATLAQVFAWTIALLMPRHISLAGAIADLGDEFLQLAVQQTRDLVLPGLVDMIDFTVDDTPNLVAIGAAAKAVQFELGLV